MSTKRRESAKRIRAADGSPLCSCGCGRAPEYPRRSWFSEECVNGWRIKNDPGYVRLKVAERDNGVCALCGIDTVDVRRNIDAILHEPMRYWKWWARRLAQELQPQYSTVWEAHYQAEKQLANWRREIELRWAASSEWQADHIVPVCKGGGQCGLENYRTLCVGCHKKETAALAAQRASERRKARSETV